MKNLTKQIAEHHQLSGKDAEKVGVKSMPTQFKAEGGGDTFTAIMSNATIDSDNEVLLPSGAMLKRFNKSGPGYFMHDYNSVPVFVPVGEVEFDGTNLLGRGRWLSSPHAKDVREFVEAMHAEGKSAGVSVGAIYHETRKPTKKDKSIFGENVKTVVSKWELLEFSIAPIQANPEAYTTSVGKRLAKSLLGGVQESDMSDVIARAEIAKAAQKALMMHRQILAIQNSAYKSKRQAQINSIAAKAVTRKKGLLFY